MRKFELSLAERTYRTEVDKMTRARSFGLANAPVAWDELPVCRSVPCNEMAH